MPNSPTAVLYASGTFCQITSEILGSKHVIVKRQFTTRDFIEQVDDLSYEVNCTLLPHPNIIRYLGGMATNTGIGIVIESLGADLRSIIQSNLKNVNLMHAIQDIACGMNFLHSLNPHILV